MPNMEFNNKSDIELVKIIKKTNSSDAYLELKKRNEKSYYRICEIYSKKVPNLKYHEIIEDCDFVLNLSVQSFKTNQNTKFSSWHTNQSRYHILNTIKKINDSGHISFVENSDLDLLNNHYNTYKEEENYELDEKWVKIINDLEDENMKKVMFLRYYADKQARKWKNISKTLNLSQQWCMYLYNQGNKIIAKEINKIINK
jgi:hypothetical protein